MKIKWERKAIKRGGSVMVTVPPELAQALEIEDKDILVLDLDPEKRMIEVYKKGISPHKWEYDHLIDLIYNKFETYLAHHPSFSDTLKICEEIRDMRKKGKRIPAELWYQLYEKIAKKGAFTSEIRVNFEKVLRDYLESLNRECGYNFKL